MQQGSITEQQHIPEHMITTNLAHDKNEGEKKDNNLKYFFCQILYEIQIETKVETTLENYHNQTLYLLIAMKKNSQN